MERPQTRRRFVGLVGLAALLPAAGCNTEGDANGTPAGTGAGATPGGDSASATPEPSPGAGTGTADRTDGPAGTADGTGAGTATGTTAGEPYANGDVHFHGFMQLVVNGEWYTFGDDPTYWRENVDDPHFFFHDDDSTRTYHVRSRGVTLAYAADAMPEFDLTANSVTYRGRTYANEDAGTTVTVLADGEPVDPSSFVFQPPEEGESSPTIEIRVETDDPLPPADGETGTADDTATADGTATEAGTTTGTAETTTET